jgi:hypothetical protein
MQDTASDEVLYVDKYAIQSVLSIIKDWRDNHDNLFLFDATINADVTWPVFTFNIEIAMFLKSAVERYGKSLTTDEWDLIMCGTIAWIQSVFDARNTIGGNGAVVALSHAVFCLLHQLTVYIETVVSCHREAHPPNLFTEWNDVFLPPAVGMALPLFLKLCDVADARSHICVSLIHQPVLTVAYFCLCL